MGGYGFQPLDAQARRAGQTVSPLTALSTGWSRCGRILAGGGPALLAFALVLEPRLGDRGREPVRRRRGCLPGQDAAKLDAGAPQKLVEGHGLPVVPFAADAGDDVGEQQLGEMGRGRTRRASRRRQPAPALANAGSSVVDGEKPVRGRVRRQAGGTARGHSTSPDPISALSICSHFPASPPATNQCSNRWSDSPAVR